MAKILLISDTHSKHKQIHDSWLPEADIIIHAGDYCSYGYKNNTIDFLNWFSSLKQYKHKIFIDGNHDHISEQQSELFKTLIPENLIYLNDSGIEIEGIKFWGSPVSPSFYKEHWVWNRDRGQEIKAHWDLIPEDTEFLICHTPMNNILDSTLEGENVGCNDLLERFQELKNIKAIVSGHIHESRGFYRFVNGQLCINASLLNRSYMLVNKPFLVDTEQNYQIINY